MGLADGDLYVSGSILSFQQMRRIYQNFRAATVPSNLQAGGLWSKSTDDTLWMKGASALVEVYTENSEIPGGAGINLIINSGFGVGSQSALTDIDDEISVTDIASGVCTTGDTKNLQVGDLVKFNGGGTTGTNLYEVTALTTDTNFTIHDTSITDGTNVTCDEATPAFIAADSKAPDTWTKTSTLDLYRWFNHPTYHKGMYGLQVTKGANGAEYLNAFGSIASKDHHYLRFRGRTVTFGCWVYSVTAADNVKLQINDSDGTEESSFVAAGALTWVEVTRTCGASITSFTPRILFDGDTADVAYISRPMLVFGSCIEEGNYQPARSEVILFEVEISSTLLNGLTEQGDSVAWTTVNVEADTDGKVPKGAKELRVYSHVNDSGSAGVSCGLQALDVTSGIRGHWHRIFGLANDATNIKLGFITCSPDGDFTHYITATGADTFDINMFRYLGVLIN